MFLGSKLLMTSVLAVGLTDTVTAQENVATTKVATKLPDLVSSQTGNVQLRNYLYELNKDGHPSERESLSAATQVRTNLTVKTFKDKVATTLILGATTGPAAPDPKAVTQRRPRLVTEAIAYDSSYFALTPYLELYGPQTDPGTRGDLGFRPELKHPAIKTALGDLNFGFYVEAEGQFESRKKDKKQRTTASASRQKELGLVEEGDKTAATKKEEGSRGVAYEAMYVPTVTLNMDRVIKGLTLLSYAEYTNAYEPVNEITDNGEGQSPDKKTVYEPTRDVVTYVAAIYQITPNLTFENDVIFGHSGLYERRGDSLNRRITNFAMLSYKMY